MGLLTAPWHGFLWIVEEIAKRAESELYDPTAVAAELAELYQQLDAGTIDEVELARREQELVSRLDAIAERNRRRVGGAP